LTIEQGSEDLNATIDDKLKALGLVAHDFTPGGAKNDPESDSGDTGA
jgi:hypothetical protein